MSESVYPDRVSLAYDILISIDPEHAASWAVIGDYLQGGEGIDYSYWNDYSVSDDEECDDGGIDDTESTTDETPERPRFGPKCDRLGCPYGDIGGSEPKKSEFDKWKDVINAAQSHVALRVLTNTIHEIKNTFTNHELNELALLIIDKQYDIIELFPKAGK